MNKICLPGYVVDKIRVELGLGYVGQTWIGLIEKPREQHRDHSSYPRNFNTFFVLWARTLMEKERVMFAMTAIKGVGRRYANIVLKKADIDLDKRAGECTEEEV
uniref:Small ribosomal subunit protein uS13 n=1 Tax=Timema bartmani TaxID=61472 RepID=A0A7R9I8L0_9NEOP|nr:unnamed protein product [Timema bartmani]